MKTKYFSWCDLHVEEDLEFIPWKSIFMLREGLMVDLRVKIRWLVLPKVASNMVAEKLIKSVSVFHVIFSVHVSVIWFSDLPSSVSIVWETLKALLTYISRSFDRGYKDLWDSDGPSLPHGLRASNHYPCREETDKVELNCELNKQWDGKCLLPWIT